MMLAPNTLPIHVTSDRQVRNLLEITKTHGVRLCVSSRSKVETVSEFREEDDEADECVEYLLVVRPEIADMMMVQPIDGWRFFVKGGKMDCVVDLEHGKCDCGVYAVEKIPFSHVIAAGTSAGLHISTLELTCFPPDVKRGLGRQKKSRCQSWLELSRMRGRKPRKQHMVYRCSKCKETGYTKPQCKK
ncbi:hypothetical protein F2Q68_00022110 [Brassica cretica]|uniref:SWIM-type domain-containing protein n=1 Tax=Brassica cretica TaxID=69181 RepID=A0A8S9G435_BRACR|nr:hypothetical protein F2Q68_00022110 [Brassica cretica]